MIFSSKFEIFSSAKGSSCETVSTSGHADEEQHACRPDISDVAIVPWVLDHFGSEVVHSTTGRLHNQVDVHRVLEQRGKPKI